MLLQQILKILRYYRVFFSFINLENIFVFFGTIFYILCFICMLSHDFNALYKITFLPEIIKLLENNKSTIIDNHFLLSYFLGKYLITFKELTLTPLDSFYKSWIIFNLFIKFVTNLILLKSNTDIDFRITFVVNKIQHLINNFVSPNILNMKNFKEFSIYLELLEKLIKKNQIYLSNEDFLLIQQELQCIKELKEALVYNNDLFILNENHINDTLYELEELVELTDKLSIINVFI